MTVPCVFAVVLAAAAAEAGPAMDSLSAAARRAGAGETAQAFDNSPFLPAASVLVAVHPDAPPPPASPVYVPTVQFTPPPHPDNAREGGKGLPVRKFYDGVQVLSSANGLFMVLASIPIFAAAIGPAAYAVGAVVAVGLAAVVVQTSYSLYKLVF